jgi:hypothetical protein
MKQTINPEQQKQPAIRSLIADLVSKDARVHESAHLSLLEFGGDAIPLLAEALASSSHPQRWEAAKTLAEMRDPAVAPIFTQALENNDTDVRWLAAEGLLALGRAGLGSLFKALIDRPTSTWLLQGAHHVLKDLSIGRLHEGETRYTTQYIVDEGLRQKIQPVLAALDSAEPYLTLSPAAKTALVYLQQTG